MLLLLHLLYVDVVEVVLSSGSLVCYGGACLRCICGAFVVLRAAPCLCNSVAILRLFSGACMHCAHMCL